ncbi:MAG TPA: ATP-binding cassette domain-containing protein [Chloroflexota bacterium]|nr:ATP-binding cassette domain-containing protein [Chloroflexota bacterium]
MPPAIEARHLTKTFASRQTRPGLLGSLRAAVRPEYRQSVAVAGLSFAVEPGEVVAFMGPNGAGKSTTVKMLTGILHPSGGEATVLGLVPWRQRGQLAYQMAAVFGQKSQLWYHLPPQATFDLLARVYDLDPPTYRRRAAELIELFELAPHLRTPVRRLSLGERMRCELAAALLHAPRVLFLDEPTIGLDVVAKQRIRALLRRLNQVDGVTVFLTSHDAGDVEQICRRVVVVNHGRIILDTAVASLKRDYLQSRVIEVKLEGESAPPQGLPFPGVTTLERADWGLRVRVDTTVQPVDAVIAHLVQRYRVADIAIAGPPLESIIADIYQRRPDEVPAGAPAGAPEAAPGRAPGREAAA